MAWNNFNNPYMYPGMGQYNPQTYMQMMNTQTSSQLSPFNPQTSIQQSNNGLIRVNGIDGAKAFQMVPNSVVALFDGNEDIFYIKTSDGAGFSTIKSFQFYPIEDNPSTSNSNDYATKEELANLKQQVEEVKGMISSGKQSISEQSATGFHSKPNK